MKRIIVLEDIEVGEITFYYPGQDRAKRGLIICPHMRPVANTYNVLPNSAPYCQTEFEPPDDYITCDQGCPFFTIDEVNFEGNEEVVCQFDMENQRVLGTLEKA